jgi:hypothetical protein
VNRLPEVERTALVLDVCSPLTHEQIAGLLRQPKLTVSEGLDRTWRRLAEGGAPDSLRPQLRAALLEAVPPMPAAGKYQGWLVGEGRRRPLTTRRSGGGPS